MPHRSSKRACVPETILGRDGREETVMLDEKYVPYQGMACTVENLCGSFTEMVSTGGLPGVVVDTRTRFGRQKEVFSVHGNVSISRGKGSFMGARNMGSIARLSSALNLESPRNCVHMAVICAKVGRRMQVKSGGLLEASLLTRFRRNIRVMGRSFDHTNSVNISVRGFTEPDAEVQEPQQYIFALSERFRPDKNMWTVTGRGVVMARFSWAGIEWTQACEDACLALCDRVVTRCIAV